MSNFYIFDTEHLKLLLEPFAPGMTPHITPIKYEAITPDCFLLLFRTTARNGDIHYLVSLEADYQKSLDVARRTIEEWDENKVIAFWPLMEKRSEEPSEDIEDFQSKTSGPYMAMLADVHKPTRPGYWTDSITIMPGDSIGDKIKGYPEKTQDNIRKGLAAVLRHKTDPTATFIDQMNTQDEDIMANDTNQTDMAASVYIKPDDSVEIFFNYVHQSHGDKPRDPKVRSQ